MIIPPSRERARPSPVAVVVTVYNKAPYARDCIESVLTQTYAPVELVVVDDGSTDGSWDIVQSATLGTDVTLLRLSNGGVSRARNLGFEACRTKPEYVLFLDADDVLLPDALQTMVVHLNEHPVAALCYSVPLLIDEDGTSLGIDQDRVRWASTRYGRRKIADSELETPLEAIWSRFRAIPSSSLIRCSAFRKTTGWDSYLCRPHRPFHAEDKDMTIQLALTGEIHRLDNPTVKYRQLPTAHQNSLYEGLLAVDRKWWNAPLGRDTRRKVRSAIRFDSFVVILQASEELRTALLAGSVRDSIAGSRQLLRSILRWIGLPIRLRINP
ncbi:glycosyltransferase family A protein [Hyphomicrobium sp.]|jgi:glycosyltransferase involved in cell wall biosynthesis|uniref:glycosyltransferase family A protein n=1 Tax=Hyphomicrobium sp. TaxID=82 RepID=UPI00356321CF